MNNINEVNERGFGEILNHVNLGIYITDTDRRIVFWNRKAEEITGFSADEVLGHRCSANILRHRDKNGRPLCTTELCPLHRSIARAQASEAPVLVYAVSKTGKDLALSVSTAPVLGNGAQVIGGVEVFRDESQSIRQMELARTVQRQMLTEHLPEDERVCFAVQYAPKELVSGDFYHVRRLGHDQFAVFLADAAGHSVSAALSTALMYSLIMECEGWLGDPAALMTELNARACDRAPGLGFFTAVSATVDVTRKTVAFCSAGHPPLLHQPVASTEVSVLAQPHLPLGVRAGTAYKSTTVEAQSGDRLMAYSDGATDIPVGSEGRLGVNGLCSLMIAHPAQDDPRLTELFDALLECCAAVEPDDDITLVSCVFH